MGAMSEHFERLYRAQADPWHVGTAWYERRKRALLLAMLGRETYLHAFEPGCGAGDLTRILARRCSRLCAVDVSIAAIGHCRGRLAADGISNVDIMVLDLPRHWPPAPPGGFDGGAAGASAAIPPSGGRVPHGFLAQASGGNEP